MDVRNEKLLKHKSNVRNYELNIKTKVSQKGRTFYSKRMKNVQSGTR